MNKSLNKLQIHRLVLTGILAAVVAVLQVFSGYIHFGPFSITLALIPIIVGGALCGPVSGAFLGLVMSAIVLINDAAAFLAVNPLGTVVTVLLKGTLAGLCSALVFKALNSRSDDTSPNRKTLRVLISGIFCPIVNTGLFVLGCYAFFMPTINGWAAAAGFDSGVNYIIFGMIGINFLVELATVTLFSPVIVRLIYIGKTVEERRNAQ